MSGCSQVEMCRHIASSIEVLWLFFVQFSAGHSLHISTHGIDS